MNSVKNKMRKDTPKISNPIKWVALITLMVQKGVNGAFCKFLYKDYFNFETINYISKPHTLQNKAQVYPSLCNDNSNPEICDRGNLFLIDSNGKCTVLATSSKGGNYDWERRRVDGTDIFDDARFLSIGHIEKKQQLLGQDYAKEVNLGVLGRERMVFNTTIFYTKKFPNNQILNSQGIEEISYAMVCPDVYKKRQSQYKVRHVEKTLYFIYRGNKACSFDLIEASVFLKRHKSFAAVIFGISIFVMLFGNTKKQLSLGLTGFEIGLFASVVFLADFEHYSHLEGPKIYLFYSCCFLIGITTGIFCAFSTESAIFLQAFNAATVTTFMSTSIYCLTFDEGINQTVFWAGNVVLSVVLVAITASPKFIYNYAYKFYINYNQPFFFTYCIALYFDLYPEILTMKVAKEYEIRFPVNKFIWFIIVLQVLGILFMVMNGFDLLKKEVREDDTERVEERDLLSAALCKGNGSNRLVDVEDDRGY